MQEPVLDLLDPRRPRSQVGDGLDGRERFRFGRDHLLVRDDASRLHAFERDGPAGSRSFGATNGLLPSGFAIRPASSAAWPTVISRERRCHRTVGRIREEEPFHGGLHAVRALPEVHGVEVLLEDLALGVPVGELHREDHLLELAVHGPA